LVPGDADEPGGAERRRGPLARGGDRRQERLRRQVLRQRAAAAAREQVAVDLWQRDLGPGQPHVSPGGRCGLLLGPAPLSSGRPLLRRRRVDWRRIMATRHATDEAAIRQQIDNLVEAIRAMDVEAVQRVYAPDVVSFDVQPPLRVAGVAAKRTNWEDAF